MIPPPALDPAPAVLTAAQEQAFARLIRAGRRARLLAQRHLAARLRRDLPSTSPPPCPRAPPPPSSSPPSSRACPSTRTPFPPPSAPLALRSRH